MGRIETLPTCDSFTGVKVKVALSIVQDEVAGRFPILKGQVPDVIDEKEKLRGKASNLFGEVVVRSRLEWQANDVRRPTHQFPQLLVLILLRARSLPGSMGSGKRSTG